MTFEFFRPGDIVLVRGTRFRSRLSRLISFMKWNHAVLYSGDNRVQELGLGGTKSLSFSNYVKKDIVVLRLRPIDVLVRGSREIAFVKAMNELKNVKFDWKASIVRLIFHIPKFNVAGKATCETYVELVYNKARRGFAPHDLTPKLDIYDLMRNDYSDQELYHKYDLIKVYDYRAK